MHINLGITVKLNGWNSECGDFYISGVQDYNKRILSRNIFSYFCLLFCPIFLNSCDIIDQFKSSTFWKSQNHFQIFLLNLGGDLCSSENHVKRQGLAWRIKNTLIVEFDWPGNWLLENRDILDQLPVSSKSILCTHTQWISRSETGCLKVNKLLIFFL